MQRFFRPGRVAQATTSVLLIILLVGTASAGVVVTGSDGISSTQANGITYTNTSGFMASGTDGALAFTPNGISAPYSNGIRFTGADAGTYAQPNGLLATGVDETTVQSADALTLTGTNGILLTDALGNNYQADSVFVQQPNGIVFTGADGIVFTGADGIVFTGADGGNILSADGIFGTNPAGIVFTGADAVTATGPDGTTFTVDPNGIVFTGADGIVFTGADGIVFTGADALELLGLDGLPVVGSLGLQGVDAELADLLDRATDDSSVNAAIVYHQTPTGGDIANLIGAGILGGTRFKVLPVIMVTATKAQLLAVSHFPAVRAIYGNRTLKLTADNSRATTGVARVPADSDLTSHNLGTQVNGAGVRVAVIDTGLNGLHADIAGRVAQNVLLLQTPPLPVGFLNPVNLEGQLNTDLLSGHGTFVGGIIAGNGTSSGGRLKGVAPGAQLVGLSAGVLDLPHVLAGLDYVLDKGASLNIRVVNCSFSASTVFDLNDPINIATKMLHDQGVSVVFSAGNSGPGWNSLNPYAAAPWVISVGATDDAGRLASYSSRGSFGSGIFRPTLVAPGTSVISLRSSPVLSVTGILGIESGADLQNLNLLELPFYTTASGTSFSAPQVAGTIALMLQANPSLTPDQIREILQRSATPLPPYLAHEVGAGMLNAHAAVLEAAFPERRMGAYRATLGRGQVSFAQDSLPFTGTVNAVGSLSRTITIPANTVEASAQIAWGPVITTNDLALSAYDPSGVRRASSNTLNVLGLTGRRERVTLANPTPGNWRIETKNALPLLGTPQTFTGRVDVARAIVTPLSDLGSLGTQQQAEAIACVRSLVMFPFANRFRPTFAVPRRDLAQSLVLGARVPQYLPEQSHYTDVTDGSTKLFVESAQAFPSGPLFPSSVAGGSFNPNQTADRLTATIAIVRAAGYMNEAELRAGAQLNLSDAAQIPSNRRGYVAVALERNLMSASGNMFRPNDALTRSDLAHALTVLLNLATGNALASKTGDDTLGVFVPGTSAWFLRYSNTPGAADRAFVYGAAGSGFRPLVGDWDGDGIASPGLYDPATGAFFLRNSNAPGAADLTFTFGPGGAGLVAIAGDWDGDGLDSIGIYNPATGTFFLRNWLSSGAADLAFAFGAGGSGMQPIVGDWNGDGIDTVALFNPTTATFFLRNTNGPGPADVAFTFGAGGSGLVALTGDWNSDGADSVGIFLPGSSTAFLRDTNEAGPADVAFNYGPAGAQPVVGHWAE